MVKEFMTQINEGRATEVEPDNAEALLKAMTCIRDVRLRTDTINALFEPLRGKQALLRKFGILLSDDASTPGAQQQACAALAEDLRGHLSPGDGAPDGRLPDADKGSKKATIQHVLLYAQEVSSIFSKYNQKAVILE